MNYKYNPNSLIGALLIGKELQSDLCQCNSVSHK